MKNIIFLTIMLFFSTANIFCQEAYKPLLTEGKIWEVATTNTSPTDHEDGVSYITLYGDTIICDHACKILVHTNNENIWKYVLWEDNKTIYYYDESAKIFLPLMDFNLHEGDKVGDRGHVLWEDYVEVNNITYRRLSIGNEGKVPLVYWIEGIGASKDYWITLFDKHIGEYNYMTKCKENGECIFTQEDFSKERCQEYLPVLVDGRTWKLSYTYRDTGEDLPNTYMTITVDGDSVVYGKKCKKLLVDYPTLVSAVYPQYIVAYESNGKVYRIDEEGEEYLVMDMNFHTGDVFEDVNVVLKEDYMMIGGKRHKWLMIDSGIDHVNGEYLYYEVEGVGLSKDEFVNMGLIDENTYFHRLIACYDNGKCIFSAADFLKNGTSGLTTPPITKLKDDTMYDIQGRKCNDIIKGKIFIQNGKKYIKR